MGAEVLEETEFDPMFTSIEGSLSGKKLFSSVHTDGETASGCATGRTDASPITQHLSQTALSPTTLLQVMTWRTAQLSEEQLHNL